MTPEVSFDAHSHAVYIRMGSHRPVDKTVTLRDDCHLLVLMDLDVEKEIVGFEVIVYSQG